MNLKDNILADMKSAMRAKETARLETIRMLRAAIQRKEVDDRVELDDQGVLRVIRKMVKQSADAARQFADGNRQDLVDKENEMISILQQYQPEPLSGQAVEEIIEQALQESGAASIRDMGKVMGLVQSRVQGRADMSAVSARIRSLLS